MVTLNIMQTSVLNWTITIGISLIITALTTLIMYCFYIIYKLIKNFSNRH